MTVPTKKPVDPQVQQQAMDMATRFLYLLLNIVGAMFGYAMAAPSLGLPMVAPWFFAGVGLFMLCASNEVKHWLKR